MWYRIAADLVLITHFAFVLFVVGGGLLAIRWPRVAWVHVPVAIYGTVIEFLGFICPLTPLENLLRHRGGEAGYSGGFIDHYIAATIYPSGLTRRIQLVLGLAVLVLNAVVYTIVVRRARNSIDAKRAGGAA
jgi:uncharacterized membrane protein YhhN